LSANGLIVEVVEGTGEALIEDRVRSESEAVVSADRPARGVDLEGDVNKQTDTISLKHLQRQIEREHRAGIGGWRQRSQCIRSGRKDGRYGVRASEAEHQKHRAKASQQIDLWLAVTSSLTLKIGSTPPSTPATLMENVPS